MKNLQAFAKTLAACAAAFALSLSTISCASSDKSGAEIVAAVRELEPMQWGMTGDPQWDLLGVPVVETFNLWRDNELKRFAMIDELQGQDKYFDKFEAAVDKEMEGIEDPTPEQRKEAAKKVAQSPDFKPLASQLQNIYTVQTTVENDASERLKDLITTKVVEFIQANAASAAGLGMDVMLKAQNLSLLKDIGDYWTNCSDLNARRNEIAEAQAYVFSEI